MADRDDGESITLREMLPGRSAYAQVTGFHGSWTADAWIAEVGGHLLRVEIQAESAAGDDGFFGLASVTDVDDPTVVISAPE